MAQARPADGAAGQRTQGLGRLPQELPRGEQFVPELLYGPSLGHVRHGEVATSPGVHVLAQAPNALTGRPATFG
ncbi:hypothetical protein OHB49_09305 [Streptomyces sp. NBC_01717]|uniref:hypothetical protein n=1 Tax=Streptomyces sp. NBC_01717 TaxID=2975918 RepID=UPI002E2F7101|nr:hypothetical protein [Streptomyces sp. NBC_01717]